MCVQSRQEISDTYVKNPTVGPWDDDSDRGIV